MKAREILDGIERDDVIASVKEWVQIEQSATAIVVGLLSEVARDRSYLDLGFESLEAFCTEELGYSPSAASARVRAALAALLYEAIIDDLESKALSLTAVQLLAPHLTGDPIGTDLLAAARYKSCRDIKALLARRFARPGSSRNTTHVRKIGDGPVKIPILVPSEIADKLKLTRKLARDSGLTDDVAEILSLALDRYIADLKAGLLFRPMRTLRSSATLAHSSRPSTARQSRERQSGGHDVRPPERSSQVATEGALDANTTRPYLERGELFATFIQLGYSVVEAESRTRRARDRFSQVSRCVWGQIA
jgi:hypothetical protein